MANPPKYDPELYMPELLRRVGNGELLVDLYGKDGFPSNYTVHGELTRTDGRWANAYTRAREQQAHAIAEKAVRDVEKTIDPEQAQLFQGQTAGYLNFVFVFGANKLLHLLFGDNPGVARYYSSRFCFRDVLRASLTKYQGRN